MRRSRTLTRVFMHHRYQNVEALRAEACGQMDERRLFRVASIPLQYSKPTYGDIIAAGRDPQFDGHWAWECPAPSGALPKHLHEDGGRYTMVVDFVPDPANAAAQPRLPGALNIIAMPAREPDADHPGQVYLAVPGFLPPDLVLAAIRELHPTWSLEQADVF
jgi:hypothetical protein